MNCENTNEEVTFELSHIGFHPDPKSQLFSTSNENQGNNVVTVEPRFNEEPRD